MEPIGDEATKNREMFRNSHPAIADGKDREDHQWERHSPGSFLRVFGFLCTRLTQEGERDLTHGVKSSQKSSKCQCHKNPPMSVTECIRKDLILRPKASSNKWKASKRKTTNQKGPKCNWHLLAQAAHIEHVLRVYMVITCMQNSVFHAMNDRARTEEKQGLEKCMCDEMEYCRHIRTNAQCGDHESE